MSFRTDLLQVLSGGLPALIDDPTAAVLSPPQVQTQEGSAVSPVRVEEQAPSGTFRDREPFFQRVTQTQVLLGTAGIIGVLALIMVARR
jgi:hypothetical protein